MMRDKGSHRHARELAVSGYAEAYALDGLRLASTTNPAVASPHDDCLTDWLVLGCATRALQLLVPLVFHAINS